MKESASRIVGIVGRGHESVSIAASLGGRNNALNFLRLIFAAAVIVSHTWPLGGYGREADLGGLTLGGISVAGFFVISGYLITGSRLRLPFTRFLLNRVARIFPAFLVSLIVVAFVISPFAHMLGRSPWDARSAIGYLWHNAGLVITQEGISGGPSSVPFPGAWNGSLWTLAYEFAAYLMTAILLSFTWIRERLRLVAAVMVGCSITLQLSAPYLLTLMAGHHAMLADVPWLATFFGSGMLLRAFASEFKVSATLLSFMSIAVLVAGLTGTLRTLGALPFAVIILWIGARVPVSIGTKNDLSYGLYIYAFPVQQIVAALGFGQDVWVIFTLVSVLLTAPFAWASWRLVEQPAMKMSRRLSRHALTALRI